MKSFAHKCGDAMYSCVTPPEPTNRRVHRELFWLDDWQVQYVAICMQCSAWDATFTKKAIQDAFAKTGFLVEKISGIVSFEPDVVEIRMVQHQASSDAQDSAAQGVPKRTSELDGNPHNRCQGTRLLFFVHCSQPAAKGQRARAPHWRSAAH